MNIKDVPGYGGLYKISDTGVVFGIKSGSGRKVGPMCTWFRNGYESVQFTDLNKNRTYHYIHTLVMKTFVGPRPEGKEINHKDNDKTNNNLDNLEYVTHSENVRHSFRFDRDHKHPSQKGEDNSGVKLTNNDIYCIRSSPESNIVLAARYGVCKRHIQYIKERKRWSHI